MIGLLHSAYPSLKHVPEDAITELISVTVRNVNNPKSLFAAQINIDLLIDDKGVLLAYEVHLFEDYL